MRRVGLVLELIGVFVGIPLIVIFWSAPPVLALLLIVASVAAIWLHTQTDSPRQVFWNGPNRSVEQTQTLRATRRFLFCTVLIVLLMTATAPERLFGLPRDSFAIWLASISTYPLLSAYPQELVCRAFFFQRYRSLFPGRSMLPASALAFATIHTVYENVTAVALSLVAGWFFSESYAATRSLRLVWLEHTLYGLMIFSIGLEPYFIRVSANQ